MRWISFLLHFHKLLDFLDVVSSCAVWMQRMSYDCASHVAQAIMHAQIFIGCHDNISLATGYSIFLSRTHSPQVNRKSRWALNVNLVYIVHSQLGTMAVREKLLDFLAKFSNSLAFIALIIWKVSIFRIFSIPENSLLFYEHESNCTMTKIQFWYVKNVVHL